MGKREWSIYIRKSANGYSAHVICDDGNGDNNAGVVAATCLTYKEACEYEELFNRILKGGRI